MPPMTTRKKGQSWNTHRVWNELPTTSVPKDKTNSCLTSLQQNIRIPGKRKSIAGSWTRETWVKPRHLTELDDNRLLQYNASQCLKPPQICTSEKTHQCHLRILVCNYIYLTAVELGFHTIPQPSRIFRVHVSFKFGQFLIIYINQPLIIIYGLETWLFHKIGIWSTASTSVSHIY